MHLTSLRRIDRKFSIVYVMKSGLPIHCFCSPRAKNLSVVYNKLFGFIYHRSKETEFPHNGYDLVHYFPAMLFQVSQLMFRKSISANLVAFLKTRGFGLQVLMYNVCARNICFSGMHVTRHSGYRQSTQQPQKLFSPSIIIYQDG